MNPVATTDQRRATLRAIDTAEARMLPPGWDAGLEHQFGATLTDTRATAPLLIDVAEPDANKEPCAPGLCDTRNTACTGHCRYRESAAALGQSREPMPGEADAIPPAKNRRPPRPKTTTRREQINSLTKWLLAAGICAGLALIWAASI